MPLLRGTGGPCVMGRSSRFSRILVKVRKAVVGRKMGALRVHGWIPTQRNRIRPNDHSPLPQPASLRCHQIIIEPEVVTLIIETMAPAGCCPKWGRASTIGHIH